MIMLPWKYGAHFFRTEFATLLKGNIKTWFAGIARVGSTDSNPRMKYAD